MRTTAINPTILFGGLLLAVVLSGLGEHFFMIPPAGTTATLVGILFGGGIYHAASNGNSGLLTSLLNTVTDNTAATVANTAAMSAPTPAPDSNATVETPVVSTSPSPSTSTTPTTLRKGING